MTHKGQIYDNSHTAKVMAGIPFASHQMYRKDQRHYKALQSELWTPPCATEFVLLLERVDELTMECRSA